MSPEKNDSIPNQHGPFLITFSGIDGAGKSTQIEQLTSHLEGQGLRVLRLSFWDDVVVWPQMRSGVGQRAATFYRSDQSADESFEPRNYKHIRKWYLSIARAGLYVLDIVQLKRLLNTQRVHNSDVVIFDRYVYDQLANIYSRSPVAKIYIRALLKLTPHPGLAFILDASPQDAFARKPEYPLEFIYKNRDAFLELCKLSSELITITTGNTEDVEEQIRTHIRRSRLTKVADAEKTETGGKAPVVRPKNSCKGENAPTAKV